MMKKINTLFIIIFIFMMAETVWSQNYFRVEANFRKLEQYVNRVQESVKKFPSEQARTRLQLARSELDKARIYIYNSDPPDLRLAQYHMLKAKQYTDLAAKIVLNQPLKNLKFQLDDLIDQAERKHSTSRKDEVFYLLNQAKKFRRLAYDAYKSNRIIRAQEYYRIAFFFARKSLDYNQGGRMSIPEQLVELEMSVQQLIEQAEQIAGDDENLRRMLVEAEKHYQDALLEADKGNEESAIKRLKLVRRFLYRIFDQSDRENIRPAMRIENQLYSLQAFLQSLESEYGTRLNQKTRNLFEKAQTLFTEAEEAFKNGRYGQAERKISLSQRFANKVFQLQRDEGAGLAENIQFQIDETEKLLNQQQNQVNNSGNTSLINLHSESLKILERARDALESGKNGLAFQLNQAATRMSSRLQREIQSGSLEISQSSLREKYNRINNTLDQLESSGQIATRHNNIIKQLRAFTERGRKFEEEGNFILADEYYDTILAQIRQYTAKWRK
jgi:hypothetical protein